METAKKIFGKKYSQMMYEGEIQLDAALDSAVAIRKIKEGK